MNITLNDVVDVRAFCENVRSMARQGSLDDALQSVAQLVSHVMKRESSWGSVLSSPELDAVCQELGRLPPINAEKAIDEEQAVFLVTAVAGLGGHTRVLMDLASADPGKRITVLVSNVMNDMTKRSLKETLHKLNPSIQVELAPHKEMDATLKWLQDRLRLLRPARTYILQHHFDSAIVAAVQPELVDKLFYYHHCDHTLTLGVHIPHAIHVDFNGKGYHHCRNVQGVENNIYWPLVADVPERRTRTQFIASGKIVTATSGGFHKFDTSYLIEQIPYRHNYISLLPSIMKASGGEHHHIGPLPYHVLAEIEEQLKSHDIALERFIHTSWVENLASELIRRNVDLYVGSFPLGGGRATVEAMGAGIPLLLHENYVSAFFTDVAEAYPQALKWRTPDELESVISGITPDLLADHSACARAFYEKEHQPIHLKKAVRETLDGNPPPPPHAPHHHPNTLQRYLDLRSVMVPAAETSDARSTSVTSAAHTARRIATKHLAMVLINRLLFKCRKLILRR